MSRTNKRLCLVVVLSYFFLAQVWAVDSAKSDVLNPALTFEVFPAKVVASRHRYASKVILATTRSRRYRTIISSEGRKEPNFAGHYRIVTWGCGTDCHGFAIVNRITGVAFTEPTIQYVAGAIGNDEPRIDFRLDSRLLILNGLLNDDLEGKFVYEWTGKSLKLIGQASLDREDTFNEAPEKR